MKAAEHQHPFSTNALYQCLKLKNSTKMQLVLVMEKGHGEEEGKEVANERSADLMRWYVFNIAPSSVPIQGVWMGLWTRPHCRGSLKNMEEKERCMGSALQHRSGCLWLQWSKVSLEFQLFSSFYSILK